MLPLRAWVAALLVVLVGCSKMADRAAPESTASAPPAAGAGAAASPFTPAFAQAAVAPVARRVIRTADVSIEAASPESVQKSLTDLAESKGGFVVSSDTNRNEWGDGSIEVTTTVVFRVPAEAFDATLAAIRALGTRVASEKVTGQDVTEEYVDLEARIRAQHALEEQYLSILKDAKSVPDVLAVQQKLGEVRTELERVEGRRRYLENQTSLSTITVHVAHHIEVVDTGPGFGSSLRAAGRDVVSVSIGIINGAIRFVGVMLPVVVLIGLPFALLFRAWLRRRRRRRSLMFPETSPGPQGTPPAPPP